MKPARHTEPVATAATRAAAYRLEEQVGFVLRRAHQRATGVFSQVMGAFGVTPTQFAALSKLDDMSRVSQNELGRLTAMDPATIWGVVSRLMKRGYVTQRPDDQDGRQVVLELTAAGRAATQEMKAVAAAVSARILAPLSDEEAAAFLALLQRVS